MFFTRIINKIKNIEHSMYLKRKRRRLKHQNPTIISKDCVGGIISHDLGQRFCSPTINLFFSSSDFIKFLSALPYYLSLDVVEDDSDLSYPVGKIEDITIHFLHYNSFEEAREKWNERKKRVDYDNIYVMMTEKEGCNKEIMQKYDSLPYKNKVLFTHKAYPNIKCSHYMKGFENESELGIITIAKPSFWQRRYLDDYDYVSFLNQ